MQFDLIGSDTWCDMHQLHHVKKPGLIRQVLMVQLQQLSLQFAVLRM